METMRRIRRERGEKENRRKQKGRKTERISRKDRKRERIISSGIALEPQ